MTAPPTAVDVYVGLDLSTRSAACYGQVGSIPSFSRWDLGVANDRGHRALILLHCVRELLEDIKRQSGAYPAKVFVEAPLTPTVMVSIGTEAGATILLPGLVVVAELVCASRGVPTELIGRQDALGHFTGQARYKRPKKIPGVRQPDPAKAACLARCKQLRWPATTEDEADAAAIFDTGACRQVSGEKLGTMIADRPMRQAVRMR